MLPDIVAEGSDETFGFRFSSGVEAGGNDRIDGDRVDGLLGILLGLDEGIA